MHAIFEIELVIAGILVFERLGGTDYRPGACPNSFPVSLFDYTNIRNESEYGQDGYNHGDYNQFDYSKTVLPDSLFHCAYDSTREYRWVVLPIRQNIASSIMGDIFLAFRTYMSTTSGDLDL